MGNLCLNGIFFASIKSTVMSSLQGRDRTLLEVVELMYSAKSLESLHQSMSCGVGQLIPSDCFDLVLCHAPKDARELFLATPGTYTANEIEFMLMHAMEHPVAQAYGSGATGALSLSQCGSLRQWRRSALYNDGGYRRLGLRHELVVEIPGIRQSSLAVFSLVRGGRDYSPRDVETLNLLRPHMARAWAMAQRRSQGLSPELLRQIYPALSLREAEVLFWIVEGKQNAEIAVILDRRLGTIQEHVERILHKLGMENRHQMTVCVLKACYGTQEPGLPMR